MRSRIVWGSILLVATVHSAFAGVVIGGTRFVFGEKQNALSVSLRNKSSSPWLVNIRVLNGGDWPGGPKVAPGPAALMATPPLFTLKAGRENTIRIIRTGGGLPADRESLFTLSVATIPSGRPEPDSVQLAVRSRLKLFWRPAGLKGSPDAAYRQLRWQRGANGLTVSNPTPYYITLFNLTAGGRSAENAGMVAPFSSRQTTWCQGLAVCALRWQSINDYGRIMPVVTLNVSGSAAISVQP